MTTQIAVFTAGSYKVTLAHGSKGFVVTYAISGLAIRKLCLTTGNKETAQARYTELVTTAISLAIRTHDERSKVSA